jgi:hypothetical protein
MTTAERITKALLETEIPSLATENEITLSKALRLAVEALEDIRDVEAHLGTETSVLEDDCEEALTKVASILGIEEGKE